MAVESHFPKVTLYWLNDSRAQRITWLLEELKMPYNIEIFERLPSKRAPDSLKAIHPLGKSPMISVQAAADSEPVIIAESGFIVNYLCEAFGSQFLPAKFDKGVEGAGRETEAWRRNQYYLHFAEGSLMPFSIVALIFYMVLAGSPFFIKPVISAIVSKVEDGFLKPNFNASLDFAEKQLANSGGDYFCGESLTAADFMMIFPLQACKARNRMTKEKHPHLMAYIDKIESSDSYKRADRKIAEKGANPKQKL